ncbi:MAG: hypothetical protein JSV49_00985, partial [Thermoplasmata archaeon]
EKNKNGLKKYNPNSLGFNVPPTKPPFNASFLLIAIIIILSLLMMTVSTGPAGAQTSSGPKTVAGYVFKSNGELADDHDGTHVELHIIHGGEELIIPDFNGIENGWYSITLQPGEWDQGDVYWIEVDGTQWGDINGRAEDRNVTDLKEWNMVGPGSHQLDIKTVAPKKAVETTEVNIEPAIALLSGIIILVVGLYLVGPQKKITVDAIVMSRRLGSGQSGAEGAEQSTGTANSSDVSRNPRKYVYEFGYGKASSPISMGKMTDLDEHLAENSVVRVKVKGIIRTPEAKYMWYKPDLVSLDKLGDSPLLAPDSVKDLDRLWYASGRIQIDRGQSPQSGMYKRYLRNFAIFSLPFVIIEFFMAYNSYFYDYPTIPPYLDFTLFTNMVVLVVGLCGPVALIAIDNRTKKQVEILKKRQYTNRQWALLPPTSRYAGGSSSARRVDFCFKCHKLVTQTDPKCPHCQRDFISSIEITAPEAEKLLDKYGTRTAAGVQSQIPSLPPANSGQISAASAPQAQPQSQPPQQSAAAASTPAAQQGTQPQQPPPPSLPPKS